MITLRHRSVHGLAVLAAVTLAGLMAAAPLTAAAAPGDEEITWGLVPADAAGVPDGRVSFRVQIDPGETVTEHAVLTNYSTVPVTFGLAGADGVVSADGSFDVLPADEESTDVGAWVLLQEEVEVAPGASMLIPFTITVPQNATPGDHPGGVVASVTQVADGQEGAQVGVTTRVGARIHLRVSGEITPALQFTNVESWYEFNLNPFQPGRLHVSYTVGNAGNIRIGSIQQATVAGPFGLPSGAVGPAGTVVGQQREILPGQTSQVDAVFESTWPLAWMTTSLSGSLETVGDDIGVRLLPLESASAQALAIPWPQLVVLAILVLLIVVASRLRSAQKTRHEEALARARAEGARAAARGDEVAAATGP